MMGLASKLWQDEAGLTAIEYSILLCVVALAALAGWRTLGDFIGNSVDGGASSAGTVY